MFLRLDRKLHTATLLSDGKVMIAGGDGVADYLSSVSMYGPDTDTFSASTPLVGGERATDSDSIKGGHVFGGHSSGGVSNFWNILNP